MTTTTDITVPLVTAIQDAWNAIRKLHPDTPAVVITIGTGRVSHGMKYGHFAASSWTTGEDGEDIHEMFVGGEGLSRGAQATMGTLLHEAAHGIAEVRGIQDTSRGGRYHNKRYAAIAEEVGIEVAHSETLGFSTTTMPDATALEYAEVIIGLGLAMTAWRYGLEHYQTGTAVGTPTAGGAIRLPRNRRPSNNNPISLSCGCETPRKIRAFRSTLDTGSIICGVCLEPFTE